MITYVYIMRRSWWMRKIGFSNKPDRRRWEVEQDLNEKSFRKWEVEVHSLFRMRSRSRAEALEGYLHRRFSWFRKGEKGSIIFWGKRSEWFFLPGPMIWFIFPFVWTWRTLNLFKR